MSTYPPKPFTNPVFHQNSWTVFIFLMSKESRLGAVPSTDSSKDVSVDNKLSIEEITKPIDEQERIRDLLGLHVSLISLASIIGVS